MPCGTKLTLRTVSFDLPTYLGKIEATLLAGYTRLTSDKNAKSDLMLTPDKLDYTTL